MVQPPLVSVYYFILMIVQYISGVIYALTYIPCVKKKLNETMSLAAGSFHQHEGNNMASDNDAEGEMV